MDLNMVDSKSKPDRSLEPECLVPPQNRWFRPGFGLICRQVMLPLFGAALLLCAWLVQTLLGRLDLPGFGIPDWIYVAGAMLCIVRGMVMVRTVLIHPVRQVLGWVTAVSDGNMGAQIAAAASGDFEGLLKQINRLSRRMLEMQQSLKNQVSEQTQRLEQKTLSLELLYEVVSSSTHFDTVEELFSHFMERFRDVFEARASVIRILVQGKLELVHSHGLSTDSPYMTETDSLQEARQDHDHRGVDFQVTDAMHGGFTNSNPMYVVRIPIQYVDTYLGTLQLFFDDEEAVNPENRKLYFSIGQHLGVMLEQFRLDDESGRLYTVEARARFANELHDSLAQTLSGLRIQVRVLDETLHQGDEQVTWEEMEKLEEQVEEAVLELRSLIGQFRAPYQLQDIPASVAKLVERCQRDTDLSVFFQNEWQDDDLTPNMRTDVVRIVQEALNNAKKHAGASNVRVLLRNRDGFCRIVVEDDGIGYDEQQLSGPVQLGEHVGLQIMAERAAKLGADLKCESEPGEGTRVLMEFECRQDCVKTVQSNP